MGFKEYSPQTGIIGLPSWLTQAQRPDFLREMDTMQQRQVNDFKLEQIQNQREFQDLMKGSISEIPQTGNLDDIREQYANSYIINAAKTGNVEEYQRGLDSLARLNQAKNMALRGNTFKIGNTIYKENPVTGVPEVYFRGEDNREPKIPKAGVLYDSETGQPVAYRNQQERNELIVNSNGRLGPSRPKEQISDQILKLQQMFDPQNSNTTKPNPVPTASPNASQQQSGQSKMQQDMSRSAKIAEMANMLKMQNIPRDKAKAIIEKELGKK